MNWASLSLLVLSGIGAQISLWNTIICYLITAKSVLMLIKVKIRISLCPGFNDRQQEVRPPLVVSPYMRTIIIRNTRSASRGDNGLRYHSNMDISFNISLI